ncbi:MAG: cell wall hydrolase [Firmicutes bacterium]|nr:cell wall hydrolase [Bacillota bacterium]
MKSSRNRKVLLVIGVLTAIGIVLSSIVFEVKPLASEYPQTLEERTLFDESIFESEGSSEVSRKLPTSAQAVHMMTLMGVAPGKSQDQFNEAVTERITPAEEDTDTQTDSQETDSAEVVSSPLPASNTVRMEKILENPYELVADMTPYSVFEKRNNITAPIAVDEKTEEKTEDISSEETSEEEPLEEEEEELEEQEEEESVYEEAYTADSSGNEEESEEESSEEITEETSETEEEEESSEESEEEQPSEPSLAQQETSEETQDEDSLESSDEGSETSETEESSEPEESSETTAASTSSSWESDPGTTSRGVSTDASRVVDGYTELDYLAALCQCEAGPYYDGSLAVANCVLNRLYAGFESNIYDVIYAPYQFATGRIGGYLANNDVSSVCYQAAQDALNGVNNIGDYLFFNGVYWLDPLTLDRPYVVIGGNCFY